MRDSSHASTASDTIEGLQVLRAVASLMVVVHHATHSVPGAHWLPFGGAGVDIFFVISGFVMAYTTQNLERGRESANRFLRRRIARIVPLYWVAVLWVSRRTLSDPNLFKDLFFIPRPHAPLVQGWTLEYEMLFYVMFALCMLFQRRLTILILMLAVLPLLGSLLPGHYGEFYGRDITLEFGFGVLLQLAISRWGLPRWSRATWLVLMAIGFVGLIGGYAEHPRSLTQGLPAVLVVCSSIKPCQGWLKVDLLKLLGDASYAIYLFHWPAFGAVKPLTALLGPTWITTLMLAHILVATLAGCLIHLLVEKRLTRSANIWLGLKPRRQLAYAP